MRKLLIFVIALGVVYGGYWLIGSAAVERGAKAALAQVQADGWDLTYDSLVTRGFPSRFDTTLTNISLRDPGTGIGWQAPFFQLLALSYLPNRVIAIWPNDQTVIMPGQTLQVTSDRLRASVAVGANTALTLTKATAETGPLTVVYFGWRAAIDKGLVALRQAAGDNSYDVYADLTALTLPAALKSRLDPAADLPAALSVVRADTTLTLDRPLDRHLEKGPPPALQTLVVKDLNLTWGKLTFRASGQIVADAQGRAEGRLDIRADDWRGLIALAVNAGLIDPGVAPTVENMGTMITGGADMLDLPLTFSDGRMALGLLPLGAAPMLR